MSQLFSAREELRIGRVVEVSGSNLKIELDSQIETLVRSIDGKNYPVGQVGSVVKVHFGRRILFAFVKMLRMKTDLDDETRPINPDKDARVLEADLFGQGEWSLHTGRLQFIRGVETYPLPLQSAYICLDAELECVYEAAEKTVEDDAVSPLVTIGNYVGSNKASCRANIDKLFGQHFAVLGSTGSGKSATVAAVLHSILEHPVDGDSLKPIIIVIDPHGEYTRAFGEKAEVFRAYDEASASDQSGVRLKLPYWLMSADEFRSLVIGKTEFEATSQNNIVYDGIAYARQVEAGLVRDIGDDAQGSQRLVPAEGASEDLIANFDRDKPLPFKLTDFEKHVDQIQGRKPGKTENLAMSGREKVDSILKKLRILRSNPKLNFMMEEYSDTSPSLIEVIKQFVGEAGDKSIRIIDISGLPNEVAGPLNALIARLLFQYKIWQSREERKKNPVLFVCEEAHRYVPNDGEAQYKEAQDAIRRLAKEGRKYGLGLGLISQRPSDVEGTVLSQCNSWIVLRLTNSRDQDHVSRFLPDNLSGLTKMLPSLSRREAIFVGEAAALPSRIKIKELEIEKLPDSNDIEFAKGWLNAATNDKELASVIKAWTGSE